MLHVLPGLGIIFTHLDGWLTIGNDLYDVKNLCHSVLVAEKPEGSCLSTGFHYCPIICIEIVFLINLDIGVHIQEKPQKER